MRGEPPRTVRLLAEAAPEAITQRDASGLTPMHWLWIRFVTAHCLPWKMGGGIPLPCHYIMLPCDLGMLGHGHGRITHRENRLSLICQ